MSSRTRLLAGLATIVLLATGCDWSMTRFVPSRSAYNPEDKIPPGNVASLTEEWTAAVGRFGGPPVVVGSRVFVSAYAIPPASNGTLNAFDAAGATNCSGTPRVCAPVWSTPSSDRGMSAPTVAAGNVFVGAGHFTTLQNASTLDAYRVSDGTRAFHLGPGNLNAGVVWNDTLYLAVIDVVGTAAMQRFIPYLGAFDTKTGAQKFVAARQASDVFSEPAVDGGVLFATASQTLFAFDARGVKNCSTENPIGSGPFCTPLWSANLGQNLGAPAVSVGRVYVGGSNGTLFALDAAGCGAEMCAPLWRAPLTTSALSDAAIAHGTVYTGGADGKLYAVPAAGCGASTCTPAWSATTDGAVMAPSVAGSLAFVASGDHHVYAYDARGCGASTCRALSDVDAGAPIEVPVVISGGRLFARDTGGTLHAYGLPTKL